MDKAMKNNHMKFGAWIHERDLSLDDQIAQAKEAGLSAIRSYSLDYAQRAAPALKQNGMSLIGGIHVDGEALAADWRSQIHLDQLAKYHELDVPLEAICVGNELRQGGDSPNKKFFTARLSFGLANLLDTYRSWLDQRGITTPLTYAMEGIVFDELGLFYEWVWPLIDALDIVSVNLYPMGVLEWHGWGAFDQSRKFLTEPRVRNDRLALFEIQLRQVLGQLEALDKPLMLSETGFPSATGYTKEAEKLVIPISENELYEAAMHQFVGIIRAVNNDYQGRIQAICFYEWRDNLYHSKIWNVEQSPIHTAFGLCDRFGNPKFDIERLLSSK
jgi:exo-beta-1,3-glucanase (GH17 family)